MLKLERALRTVNTYSKHKSILKYNRAAKGRGGMEVKSMIHLMLVN